MKRRKLYGGLVAEEWNQLLQKNNNNEDAAYKEYLATHSQRQQVDAQREERWKSNPSDEKLYRAVVTHKGVDGSFDNSDDIKRYRTSASKEGIKDVLELANDRERSLILGLNSKEKTPLDKLLEINGSLTSQQVDQCNDLLDIFVDKGDREKVKKILDNGCPKILRRYKAWKAWKMSHPQDNTLFKNEEGERGKDLIKETAKTEFWNAAEQALTRKTALQPPAAPAAPVQVPKPNSWFNIFGASRKTSRINTKMGTRRRTRKGGAPFEEKKGESDADREKRFNDWMAAKLKVPSRVGESEDRYEGRLKLAAKTVAIENAQKKGDSGSTGKLRQASWYGVKGARRTRRRKSRGRR
jgi:hypothetical protein